MGKVARERWLLLASTASLQRLAAIGLAWCAHIARPGFLLAKGNLHRRLIQRSAWKANSRKFRVVPAPCSRMLQVVLCRIVKGVCSAYIRR